MRLILQRLTHHPARAQHKNDANSSVKSTFWHRITDLASHDESIARHIQLTRCLLLRVAREWREAWFGRLIDELSARNSSCMLASKRAESYVDLFDDATWFRSDMVICGCGARKLNSRPKKNEEKSVKLRGRKSHNKNNKQNLRVKNVFWIRVVEAQWRLFLARHHPPWSFISFIDWSFAWESIERVLLLLQSVLIINSSFFTQFQFERGERVGNMLQVN